ncbi:MAG TPA: bifunctional phosphopantothenoylcysteine decarboxylase/phosphopantothenate--cysteine ligase CoaBC [Dehalococcoidia bacterium]|nr:bifunctional phosphopantothenoylcysteine decarboxylase/phosphopantothenate--cysteine ligase CoaBC [Dehalococcoidia bacterium]
MSVLRDRQVVLGVTGSVACYKAADLASKLVQQGANVDVVMTDAAREFITPFTFRALTGRLVFTNMFEPVTDLAEEHVEVARRADIVVIAPASATTLARLAHGLADDFLALTVLATKAPVLIAPAMDSNMWEAAATRANVELLRSRGFSFVGPAEGRLASGRMGTGRLAEVADILGAIVVELAKRGDLAGRRIVVSAGGTREPIDPVRFISNRSTGKMGFAVAEAARDRGAEVTLITTTRALPIPYGVKVVDVSTVAEMRRAVLEATEDADVLVMAAAVSDFRPAEVAAEKIKKREGGLVLELRENEDFFHEVPDRVIKVAFAAETQDVVANARLKPLSHGHLDLICANDVSAEDSGFAVDTNRVTILDAEGGVEELPLLTKYEVAHRILDRVVGLLASRSPEKA